MAAVEEKKEATPMEDEAEKEQKRIKDEKTLALSGLCGERERGQDRKADPKDRDDKD